MCFKVKIIAECKVLLEFCSNAKFEKKKKKCVIKFKHVM